MMLAFAFSALGTVPQTLAQSPHATVGPQTVEISPSKDPPAQSIAPSTDPPANETTARPDLEFPPFFLHVSVKLNDAENDARAASEIKKQLTDALALRGVRIVDVDNAHTGYDLIVEWASEDETAYRVRTRGTYPSQGPELATFDYQSDVELDKLILEIEERLYREFESFTQDRLRVQLRVKPPPQPVQAEPTDRPLPPPSPRFHPRRLGVAGITLAGIGGVSLLTGVGLLFAHGLERPLEGGFEGDEERLETMLAGVTTLAAGGAMAVVGLGLVSHDAREQRRDKPDPRRMGPLGIAGFTTVGVGATAALVGATLAARGDVEWVSLEDERVVNTAYLRTAGWITLGVGLGTVVAGAAILGVDARRRKLARTAVLVPSITMNRAHLVLAGRF